MSILFHIMIKFLAQILVSLKNSFNLIIVLFYFTHLQVAASAFTLLMFLMILLYLWLLLNRLFLIFSFLWNF